MHTEVSESLTVGEHAVLRFVAKRNPLPPPADAPKAHAIVNRLMDRGFLTLDVGRLNVTLLGQRALDLPPLNPVAQHAQAMMALSATLPPDATLGVLSHDIHEAM